MLQELQNGPPALLAVSLATFSKKTLPTLFPHNDGHSRSSSSSGSNTAAGGPTLVDLVAESSLPAAAAIPYQRRHMPPPSTNVAAVTYALLATPANGTNAAAAPDLCFEAAANADELGRDGVTHDVGSSSQQLDCVAPWMQEDQDAALFEAFRIMF